MNGTRRGGGGGEEEQTVQLFAFPLTIVSFLTYLLNRVYFLFVLPLLHFKCVFTMYADIVFIRTQFFPGWSAGWLGAFGNDVKSNKDVNHVINSD